MVIFLETKYKIIKMKSLRNTQLQTFLRVFSSRFQFPQVNTKTEFYS